MYVDINMLAFSCTCLFRFGSIALANEERRPSDLLRTFGTKLT